MALAIGTHTAQSDSCDATATNTNLSRGSTISKIVAENARLHKDLFEPEVQMWVFEEDVVIPSDSKHAAAAGSSFLLLLDSCFEGRHSHTHEPTGWPSDRRTDGPTCRQTDRPTAAGVFLQVLLVAYILTCLLACLLARPPACLPACSFAANERKTDPRSGRRDQRTAEHNTDTYKLKICSLSCFVFDSCWPAARPVGRHQPPGRATECSTMPLTWLTCLFAFPWPGPRTDYLNGASLLFIFADHLLSNSCAERITVHRRRYYVISHVSPHLAWFHIQK